MRNLIAILTLAAVLCGCGADSVSSPAPSPVSGGNGSTEIEIPSHLDIKVYRQNGDEVTLNDFVGMPIVLNFWASWCPPCVSEMPHFSKIDAETDDVLFLMINMTDGISETQEKVEQFLEESDLIFKNMLFDINNEAMMEYKIQAIPTTVFIDEKGAIVSTKVGALTEKQLRQKVADLLN